MKTPLHLFAGPLGVGKTTAIRRLVAQTPGCTAVVVNDFGETGYDAAHIAESGGPGALRVENIPGGCLCCTTATQLLPALRELGASREIVWSRPSPNRVLKVPPTGLATAPKSPQTCKPAAVDQQQYPGFASIFLFRFAAKR